LLESRLGLPITFGSWVYHVLPYLTDSCHFVQIGIRASKYSKGYWEKKYGIKQYWSQEISSGKISSEDIINYLESLGLTEIYITFDIDALDQQFVAATGTAEPNGLFPDETYEILNSLIQSFSLSGADLVEVAPFLKVKNTDQTMRISQNIMSILYRGMLCNKI
jgi:agmatinase